MGHEALLDRRRGLRCACGQSHPGLKLADTFRTHPIGHLHDRGDFVLYWAARVGLRQDTQHSIHGSKCRAQRLIGEDIVCDPGLKKTDIWDHIYEFNNTTSSNVVDVYIGYLRKKLDTSGKPTLIETVRGRGYRLGDASL